MNRYTGAINRIAVTLEMVPAGSSTNALSGAIKLVARFSIGTSATTKDAALILTQAEERALFGLLKGPTKLLVKWGSRFFLLGVVIDIGGRIISGEGFPKKQLEERLEIIAAHITKGSSVWSSAIGVGEQILFILNDLSGGELLETAEGVGALLGAQLLRLSPLNVQIVEGGIQAVSMKVPFDVEIEAAGFIVKPVAVVSEEPPVATFPSGPRPSFGQRR